MPPGKSSETPAIDRRRAADFRAFLRGTSPWRQRGGGLLCRHEHAQHRITGNTCASGHAPNREPVCHRRSPRSRRSTLRGHPDSRIGQREQHRCPSPQASHVRPEYRCGRHRRTVCPAPLATRAAPQGLERCFPVTRGRAAAEPSQRIPTTRSLRHPAAGFFMLRGRRWPT